MQEPINDLSFSTDDYLVDQETGEILEMAIFGSTLAAEEFHVADDNGFNWVTNKMLETQSSIDAVDNSPAVLHAKAVLANAESIKKDYERKLDWLHQRFDSELAEYAKPRLKGTSKTYKGLFAAVSFRTVPQSLKVVDEERALVWAKTYAPDSVKTTEKFLISLVGEGVKNGIVGTLSAPIESLGDNAYSLATFSAFRVESEKETVKVKL